jgi:hypothetical protein
MIKIPLRLRFSTAFSFVILHFAQRFLGRESRTDCLMMGPLARNHLIPPDILEMQSKLNFFVRAIAANDDRRFIGGFGLPLTTQPSECFNRRVRGVETINEFHGQFLF